MVGVEGFGYWLVFAHIVITVRRLVFSTGLAGHSGWYVLVERRGRDKGRGALYIYLLTFLTYLFIYIGPFSPISPTYFPFLTVLKFLSLF